MSSTNRMLPGRLVCARYSVTNRTIDRWLARGILPPPIRINGVRYWREKELAQRERELGQRKKRAGRRGIKNDDACWPVAR